MQKTIYVKEEKLWDDLKTKAEVSGISVSEYLMRGVSGLPSSAEMGVPGNKITEQLERIESKLDELLRPSGSVSMGAANLDGEKIVGAVEGFEKTYDRTEAEIIAAGQAKLDATRKDRKKEKIPVQSLTGHVGPLPKGGKKK